MGCSFFSSSCNVYPETTTKIAPNPDPINFSIINLYQVKNNVVAEIKYHDCTNFEGVKICLFKDTTKEHIRSLKEIDPHFSNNSDSPLARFKPNDNGLEIAINLAGVL